MRSEDTLGAVTHAAFAHSLPGRPEREWEPLLTHLRQVAGLAGEYAAEFGFATHGHLAGLWHDLGKFSAEFQQMIRADADASVEARSRVDHSTCGAQHAYRTLREYGWLLSYCIAGHHAGLADAICPEGSASSLERRIENESIPAVPSDTGEIEAPAARILDPPEADSALLKEEIQSLSFETETEQRAFQLSLLCRMLFSALVDADSLATERFYKPERSRGRQHTALSVRVLADRLREYIDAMRPQDTAVNQQRAAVLHACRSKAAQSSGFFSLTVPTGGGKTLSSLSFALEHADRHGLRRVVLAIPFTSIIEQNAERIRGAVERAGERVVLEHHSNVDPDRETAWSQMAAENWNAPIVVTTNVQLLESLFARSRGRCRKVHRLARSVIILDEAQSLPVRVLAPCLAVLRELVKNHGCTVVLCTATQPALGKREEFPIGLDGVREIANDVPGLFDALRRTRIDIIGSKTDEALADMIVAEPRALCIVNTRAHAADLFTILRHSLSDGLFHLSALMCAEHRSRILATVHKALEGTGPCRLVSTQVVEAGVDLDFPLVMRAMAGIDSIAQGAGRCNREGRMARGRVAVFETGRRSSSDIDGAANDARAVLPDHLEDPLSPDAVEAYFALHYWKRAAEWDYHDVMRCFSMSNRTGRLNAQFRRAASQFRLIDGMQTPILVPYGERGQAAIGELRRAERPDRNLMRRLQRFTVNVYDRQLAEMRERQVLSEPHEGVFVLENADSYDPELGLLPTGTGFDALVV